MPFGGGGGASSLTSEVRGASDAERAPRTRPSHCAMSARRRAAMRMKELMERSRKVGFVTHFLPSKQTSTMSKVLRRIGLREFLTRVVDR